MSTEIAEQIKRHLKERNYDSAFFLARQNRILIDETLFEKTKEKFLFYIGVDADRG